MTWLRTHGWQLFTALFSSIILWAFVSVVTNPDRREVYGNIPVTVVGLASDLVLVDEDGTPRVNQDALEPVEVVVEADQATQASIEQRDLQAFVDLAQLASGTHVVDVQMSPLEQSNVRFPSITPENQSIRIEQVITRTVPLTIEIEGILPFGFELNTPRVLQDGEPLETAIVSGPRSQVERVAAAAVAISIDQVSSSFTPTRIPEAIDSSGTPVPGVQVAPDTVSVRVEVRSVAGVKRVPVIGTIAGTPAVGYIVTGVQSTPQVVDIVGTSRVLAAIDSLATQPVDISGATGTVTRAVGLNFRGARPQESDLRTAQITVQIEPLNEPFTTEVRVPVQITGIADNLIATASPRVITVTLEATALTYVQLDITSLVATIDVSGRGPGLYLLVPTLALPPDVSSSGTLPTVNVELAFPATATPQPPSPTPTARPTLLLATPTDAPPAPTPEFSPEAAPAAPTDEPPPAAPTGEPPPAAPTSEPSLDAPTAEPTTDNPAGSAPSTATPLLGTATVPLSITR